MSLMPPHFGDKLDDWQRIAEAGGEAIFTGKDVLDIGPSYGLDIFAFAPKARSYTIVDSDPSVLEHLEKLQLLTKFHVARHNLQHGIPFDDCLFDTVMDLGTLDNVLGGIAIYQDCMRVLRPRGVFVCSFANRAVLTHRYSPSGDEERFEFHELEDALIKAGATMVTGMGLKTHARAGLIARK